MDRYTPHFSQRELRCKCSRCKREKPHRVNPEALCALERVRVKFGKPMTLTSAYRCENHPVEAKKVKPGKHHEGTAFDIAVPWGRDRALLLRLLMDEGFNAFGFDSDFLHADYKRPHATTWTY